jgi:hypothetical protein
LPERESTKGYEKNWEEITDILIILTVLTALQLCVCPNFSNYTL